MFSWLLRIVLINKSSKSRKSGQNRTVMTILDYIEIISRFFIYNEVPNKIQLVTVNRVKMSHRSNSSLDDTIPLDKKAYELELSNGDRTYYGSDISVSSGKNSNESSVKIVYEVINLTESNSDNQSNREVTLRLKR